MRLRYAWEQRLPFGNDEWEELALDFNRTMRIFNPLAQGRDGNSLKAKFKSLKNVRKPTGDPTCPPMVRRAKLAQRAIEGRMAVADMNSEAEPVINVACNHPL